MGDKGTGTQGSRSDEGLHAHTAKMAHVRPTDWRLPGLVCGSNDRRTGETRIGEDLRRFARTRTDHRPFGHLFVASVGTQIFRLAILANVGAFRWDPNLSVCVGCSLSVSLLLDAFC